MHAIAQPVAARELPLAARSSPGTAVTLGTIAGLLTLILYAATGARGVERQDSGVHQYRILTGQLESRIGLALSHPLHYYLGRAVIAVPLGDPVLKLNLLSGLCGAVGVGVLAGLLVSLTRSPMAAALAAVALALTHSYWQMSALTETYTLAAALMTIEWALLLRFVRTRQPLWLVAVFAVNGLHVADHLLGLLPLATYGVLLLERIARRRVAPIWLPIAMGVWIVTASPYWLLIIDHFHRTGDLMGTLQSALFGGGESSRGWAREVLNVTLSRQQLKLVILTFGYCLPSAAGLVALLGLLRPTRGRGRIFRRVLLAQTVIIFVFVGRYTVKDLYTFFVPVCTVTALWFGLGAAWLLHRWTSKRVRQWLTVLLVANAALPLVVYSFFPLVAKDRGWMRERMRDIPYRDEYLSFFRPWRFLDDSAEVLAREAVEQVGEGGWVLADATTASPVALRYLLRGGPPDVHVFWFRACLTEPGRPALTDAELVAHVQQGGRLLAVPSPDVEVLISPPLFIERSEPFWQVRVAAP